MVAGEFRRLTTPNITAKHLERNGAAKGLSPFQDVFVDLYVLSRARCLLTSYSGFSKMALWMGSQALVGCHRDMQNCEDTSVQGTIRHYFRLAL